MSYKVCTRPYSINYDFVLSTTAAKKAGYYVCQDFASNSSYGITILGIQYPTYEAYAQDASAWVVNSNTYNNSKVPSIGDILNGGAYADTNLWYVKTNYLASYDNASLNNVYYSNKYISYIVTTYIGETYFTTNYLYNAISNHSVNSVMYALLSQPNQGTVGKMTEGINNNLSLHTSWVTGPIAAGSYFKTYNPPYGGSNVNNNYVMTWSGTVYGLIWSDTYFPASTFKVKWFKNTRKTTLYYLGAIGRAAGSYPGIVPPVNDNNLLYVYCFTESLSTLKLGNHQNTQAFMCQGLTT